MGSILKIIRKRSVYGNLYFHMSFHMILKSCILNFFRIRICSVVYLCENVSYDSFGWVTVGENRFPYTNQISPRFSATLNLWLVILV